MRAEGSFTRRPVGEHDISVVVPTVGRASLAELIRAADHPAVTEIVVVDDRPQPCPTLKIPRTTIPSTVIHSDGRGPAAARNAGWRATSTQWVAFLDDDVALSATWALDLARDLDGLAPQVGGSQATIVVPLPRDRRPTDNERRTRALERAQWITADMAYRRSTLEATGGFDERFPRAFREDADLAIRSLHAGFTLMRGSRRTTHPPAAGTFFSSVHAQKGNADNALMRDKYGPNWRAEIGENPGMIVRHTIASASLLGALAAAALGKPRSVTVFAAVWVAATVRFAARRISNGPKTFREIASMATTSAVIPPLAVFHRLRGEIAVRTQNFRRSVPPTVVLLDRDNTVVVDVPYLADPGRVEVVPGAKELLDGLRARGIQLGVVSNQSGLSKGLITPEQLAAVNRRVDELLGPFDTWQICPHSDADGCRCRKPLPGMILHAAQQLGVHPKECVMIGDTEADVSSAIAAGARAILVPTSRTLPEEVRRTRMRADVANTLSDAIALALGDAR